MEKKMLQVNGKIYDAVTGQRIDGIVAPRSKNPKVTKTAQTTPKDSHKLDLAKRPANHAGRHRPAHAQTLMRGAVKKPSASIKKQLHPQSAITHDTQAIPVKHSVEHIDNARAERAMKASQHRQIHRFHPPGQVPVTFAEIPVQKAPQRVPVAAPPIRADSPIALFDHAITQATHFVDITSHKTIFRKKARRHALAMSGGIISLLLIAGFLAYQNTPKVQVQVAGAVAGVSTRMPNFKAAGFTYLGVKTNGSMVVYDFASSGSTYRLTAQATSWTGEDMINQISAVDASGTPNYQIISNGTFKVYKFSNQSATWINHGTWYQVYGNTPLSDDQLLALATHS